MSQQPLVGKGFFIIEASGSHSDTPQSVGLLWTGDQFAAETSTREHTTLTRDILAPDGIRTHNLSKQAASYPRLTGSLLYNFSDCFFRALDMGSRVWISFRVCILRRYEKYSVKLLNCLNDRDARTDQCIRQKHKLNVTKSVKFKSSASKVKKLVSIKFIIKKKPT
jgi:hypothetical protein